MNETTLQTLAKAVSRITDPAIRAEVLTAAVAALAEAGIEPTVLSKAETDGFAAGKRLAQAFNAQGRKA